FEIILLGLESTPHDAQHEHMATLAQRLIAQDRWLLLVDGALANRPLDPVLPRLLQRDPERLLDRLTLILTEQRGNELLSPMARLLRTIGPPALGLLETRLYEARRQRVLAAIKLLAGADNDRLLRALPHALASWEWNLQDLAVSEVARAANAASAGSVAFVFSAILADAHPLVVPMMIDQIGVANQVSAVPLLIEIAAGEHESLRDQFVRIKAIESLGRMRAAVPSASAWPIWNPSARCPSVTPSSSKSVPACVVSTRPTLSATSARTVTASNSCICWTRTAKSSAAWSSATCATESLPKSHPFRRSRARRWSSLSSTAVATKGEIAACRLVSLAFQSCASVGSLAPLGLPHKPGLKVVAGLGVCGTRGEDAW